MGTGTRIGVLSLLSLLLTAWLSARDDLQTWHTLNWTHFRGDAWSLQFSPQLRIHNDSSQFGMLKLTYQATRRISPSLRTGLAYTYLRDDRRDIGHNRYRLETFVRTQHSLGDDWHIQTRHRLDFSNRMDRDDGTFKLYRGLLSLSRSLAADSPWHPVRLGLSAEIFYTFTDDRVFQHRIFPLQGRWQVTESLSADLYLMIWSRKSLRTNDWTHDLVLGQTWRF